MTGECQGCGRRSEKLKACRQTRLVRGRWGSKTILEDAVYLCPHCLAGEPAPNEETPP